MPPPPKLDIFTYLTSDPQLLGILSYVWGLVTLIGFTVAIAQIVRVKRAAEAAQLAAAGMAQTVRSRELLAKLGEAHTYLEAARDHVSRSERRIAVLCLELSGRFIIEAQEISRALAIPNQDLQFLGVAVADLVEQITVAAEPLADQPEFVQLRLQLREASEVLQRNMAQSRYAYDNQEA